MESNLILKNMKPVTPVKDQHKYQSKIQDIPKSSENANPNIFDSSPAKSVSSSLTKSAKSHKSTPRKANPNHTPAVISPRNRIRERKFVVAKKNSRKEKVPAVDCKCGAKQDGNVKKCLCVAYETLRASQEEFFKSRSVAEEQKGDSNCVNTEDCYKVESSGIDGAFRGSTLENGDDGYGLENQDPEGETEHSGQTVSSLTKRRREKLLEEARQSVPASGKVMYLVEAFEKLSCLPYSKETNKKEDNQTEENNASTAVNPKEPMKWELPGMRQPKAPEIETQQVSSCSSFCPSDLVLTAENLGLDPRASVSSSWDSSRSSVPSRSSNGGRRSRRNSLDSSGTMGSRRSKKKQLKVTSQKPFKLRTEQRGKTKEEEFMKKLQEMMMEEERMRIPVAQGLPWTTDEPECLTKPSVKENTRPVDMKLHTDIRAVERADFDQQVAEKINLIEQYKMERERQQKLAEEEEIKRLRKELVPKAQPMPYFDRPFIPRRSMKIPTIPRQPRFHMPHQKKIKCCSSSWSDTISEEL